MSVTLIQEIEASRNKVCEEALKLKFLLAKIEKQINTLMLDKNRPLNEISLSETLYIANLLIKLHKEI